MIRKSKEEIERQNAVNNALAAEYKHATQERRTEILDEYYHGNEGFIKIWPHWDKQHWEDLTQIFATYWHAAFMRYTPNNESSVFNFYMERMYKSRASRDYRYYLNRQSRTVSTEFEFSNGDVKEVRELLVHPISTADKSDLKAKLSRCLDDYEKNILEGYFYGDRKLSEIRKTDTKLSPTGFLRRYEKMLTKMMLSVSRDDLRDLAHEVPQLHPLHAIGKKTKETRVRVNGVWAKAAA